MRRNLFKGFVSFVILLHCVGITQMVSAYSKDNSAFVSMLNMNEEETKKEKESKEDSESSKNLRSRLSSLITNISFTGKRIYLSESKARITDQFISDNVSPPPDFKG